MIAKASTSRADTGASAPYLCGCATCASANADWLQATDALITETSAISSTDDGDGTVTVGGSYQGAVNTEGDTDIISVVLEAGETYMISLRGTGPEALLDPFLQVSDPNNAPLGTDDDGGTYINSLMTITATVSGTYEITAGALAATGGVGTYTVDVRQMGEDAIDDDLKSNDTLTMNANTFGFIEEYGEYDVYKVTLTEGSLYTFEVAGGADYNTNYLAVPPGELDTKLTLFDAEGNEVAFNDDISFSAVPGEGDISSKIGYLAPESGTYYLRVEAYESNAGGGVGGYALTAQEDVITNLDPLDAIDWKENLGERQNKWPTTEIKVYFVPATDPTIYSNPLDGEPPEKSLGWTDYEIEQAMEALRSFSDYTNLTFTRVNSAEEATFKLVTVTSESYLGRMYPPNSSEEHEGTGFFAINWPSWDRGTPTGQPVTGALEQGADGWFTLIHEFGHGLGLAHPHDNGGNSEIMAGVTSPFDSYGVYDLNQGVYTTMSYNPGWHKHPDYEDFDGTTYGMNGTAGALDIGVLQAKYGANPTQGAGNTTYVLPDENKEGTFYKLIWDVSGIDTIVAPEDSASARIDLTAATLDYSPTGGGVVSFVDGIYGGFTIAAGVVIENATGSREGDILIGNAANNVLDGRGGLDKMIGGKGNDTYGVNSTRDLITENENGGIDRVRSSVNYTLGQHLENLVLIGTAISGTGNALVNDLTGNSKDNVLNGKGGADTMRGEGGDDFYFVDNVGDQVIELSDGGTDTVQSSVSFTLSDNVNHLILTGSAADGTGNDQNNRLTGNGAANVLDGKAGTDTLRGGGGDDTYIVDNAGDVVIETGGGIDLVRSSVSYKLGSGLNDLTLTGDNAINGTGNDGANTITGNGARNYLNGGVGNDVLNGGLGNDRLRGGDGKDNFLFDSTLSAANNVDAILDFSLADDTIRLDRSIFSGIASNGTLSAGAFRTGTAAADGGDRIIYDAATGNIFYDADGLGGASQVLFATVTPGLALTNADFFGVA